MQESLKRNVEGLVIEGWLDTQQVMADEGRRRFREAKSRAVEKGRESLVGGTRRLADVVIARLTGEIDAFVKAARKRATRGPVPSVVTDLRAVGSSTAAYIAVRTVFDGIGQHIKYTSLAISIGARLEDELRFRAYKKASSLEFGRTKRDVTQAGSYRYKRQTMLRRSTRDDLVPDWVSWSISRKTRIGAELIGVIIRATGLLEVKQQIGRPLSGRKSYPYHVMPTDKCIALIEKGDLFEELMRPWFLPMLTPPLLWSSPWDGGYDTFELPLVKRGSKAYYEKLAVAPIGTVYHAVNALQNTAWCVNEDVLEIYKECVAANITVKGMPAPQPREMPELLDWMLPYRDLSHAAKEVFRAQRKPWQKEEQDAWNLVAGAVYEFNTRRKSHAIAFAKTANVAELLRAEPCFYMPYQLDWRGRVYPVPLFLNPQGSDFSRGLLQFAESKPFGTRDAVDWWMVEGANRFGIDKVPFYERIQWVEDHGADLYEVYEDPMANLWWLKADKPFQFLAWVLEFGRWQDGGRRMDFHSSSVVSMDGSCNGLQHLSALMLDKAGAEATNLLPSDRPQDIYKRVLDKVMKVIEADGWGPHGKNPEAGLARQWHQSGLLERGSVKRQVMTTPYGATRRGMTLQLGKYVQREASDHPEIPPAFELGSAWPAILYLAPIIDDQINDTVKGARACMEWLMECARIISDTHQPIRWTVATGLPIEQFYPTLSTRRVEAILYGSRRALSKLSVQVPAGGGKCDRRKMVQAISPNYIHSMDAAHLQRTVSALERKHAGGLSWCMVHDSFGTHAADADNLAKGLREEFVGLYDASTGVGALDFLRDELMAATQLYLPEVPPLGDLDIEEVRKSLFFFA